MRKLVTFLLAILLAMMQTAAVPAAQSRQPGTINPFAGTWEVDPEAGRHLPHQPPFFRRLTIEPSGGGLRESLVDTLSLEDIPRIAVSYTLDGREGVARISGIDVETFVRFEAGKFQITWRERGKPKAPIIKRVLSVSQDGQTMTCEIYNSDAATVPAEVYVLRRLR